MNQVIKNLLKKYYFLAFIAIFINLLSQEIFLIIFSDYLYSSLLFGTLTGFLSKYILDKKYIFFSKSSSYSLIEFFSYFSTAILTTIIFWGFELTFYLIFDDTFMKLFGGFIGLVIGYNLKYFLDDKFTFKNKKT